MVMGKKAYVRTVEAILAVSITLIFITIIFPRVQLTETRGENLNILSTLENRDDFRTCVIENNGTCVNSIIAALMTSPFDYIFNLSTDPNVALPSLPPKRIFSDSVYIAGNLSNKTETIVRLYYFAKD